MALTIRAATLSDIPALVELMHEFYAESGFDLDRPWAAGAFTALLQDHRSGTAWLALDEEIAVGYVVLTVRFSMEFGGLDGFVDDLFVRPSHRRQGAASELLNALLSECEQRHLRAVHVETDAADHPAVMLYQKFGWQDRNRMLMTRRLT